MIYIRFIFLGEVPIAQASPERNSRHGSPDLEDNRNRQSPNASRDNYGNNRNNGQSTEEVSWLFKIILFLNKRLNKYFYFRLVKFYSSL